MYRFLIYGHKGWIGEQVIKLLQSYKQIKVILGKSRADNHDALEAEIKQVYPTHIMSFIGRTHGRVGDKQYKTIDYLEQPNKLKENVNDNLFSPILLAILAKQYRIHYTYMGTGCIFEYDEEHSPPLISESTFHSVTTDGLIGFKEKDIPNFFASSYSTVKGFTDRLMHFFEDTTLNVRIRMPITGSVNGRNFITKIVNYEKICSMPNSMTVLPCLLPIMIDMAMKGETGTINLVNPGLITHNEILSLYKEIVDPFFTWKNFTVEEQAKILAAGRSNNFLDTSKLRRTLSKCP